MKTRELIIGFAALMILAWFQADPLEAASGGLSFAVSKIHLDGEIHFVLPVDINSRAGSELLVGFSQDDSAGEGKKSLAFFRADTDRHYGEEPFRTMTLDPSIGVVDVGDLNGDGLDDLVVTAEGRIAAFFQSAEGLFPESPETILHLPYILPFSRDRAFHVPILRDIDHDGLDDLFLPVMNGYALFSRKERGDYPAVPSQVLRLDYSSGMRERGGILTIEHAIPIPGEIDFDGDGHLDLVFSEGDTVHFFPFDPVKAAFRSPTVVRLPVERPTFGLLQALVEDIDKDGLPDILVMRAYGKKRQTNAIHLFRGRPGLIFPEKADQSIVREGMGADPVVLDLDGDGAKELVTTTVNFGLSFFIDYFLRSKVGVDVSIYRIAGRIYDEEPVKVKKVYFKTVEEEGEPGAEQGDFNGDGLDDFALATSPDRVSFYLADPAVLLPDDPDREEAAASYGIMKAKDLNGDGRDDLVIIYRTERRRGDVTILISGTE